MVFNLPITKEKITKKMDDKTNRKVIMVIGEK